MILDENEPKNTMTVYLLLAGQDKRQVSKINVKFKRIIMKIEKNGIFPREDKLDLGAEKESQNRHRRSI